MPNASQNPGTSGPELSASVTVSTATGSSLTFPRVTTVSFRTVHLPAPKRITVSEPNQRYRVYRSALVPFPRVECCRKRLSRPRIMFSTGDQDLPRSRNLFCLQVFRQERPLQPHIYWWRPVSPLPALVSLQGHPVIPSYAFQALQQRSQVRRWRSPYRSTLGFRHSCCHAIVVFALSGLHSRGFRALQCKRRQKSLQLTDVARATLLQACGCVRLVAKSSLVSGTSRGAD